MPFSSNPMKAILSMTMNHTSLYRSIKPMVPSPLFSGTRDMPHGPLIGISRKYHNHNIPFAKGLTETQPFSLIRPDLTKKSVCKSKASKPSTHKILAPGMILLKNYISLKDQVDIVNICQKWGMGPGGFYQPTFQNGAKLRLHMMCFGRNWDIETKYKKRLRSDGSEPPPLPHELISLAKAIVQDAQAHLKGLPSMHPDICIVNFYKVSGGLGLHQDHDESSNSIRRGLPVVSISIGDSAEFLYGRTRDKYKCEKVILDSGDVLVFGGKSRLVYHGVQQIFPNSCPRPLIQETALTPGRLNLTLRQF